MIRYITLWPWRFRPCNFRGVGHHRQSFLGDAWSQLHQTWPEHKSAALHFCFKFGYLAAFSNADSSKLSDVENDPKFCTFWFPVKIRGEVGEISIPTVEALPTTKPTKYIWRQSTARVLSAVNWVKRKKSSWVKPNVLRPNSRAT